MSEEEILDISNTLYKIGKDKNSKKQLETLSKLLRQMYETEVCVDDKIIKVKLEDVGVSIDTLKKYCNIMKEDKNISN